MEPETLMIREPRPFTKGPKLCVIRAINSAFGYVAIDSEAFEHYKTVFAAQMEEEIGPTSILPMETSTLSNIKKMSIETMGLSVGVNTISFMITDTDPNRFRYMLVTKDQILDNEFLSSVDAVILMSKSHCWCIAQFPLFWMNLESGAKVKNPLACIQKSVNNFGTPILLWEIRK